MNPFNPEAGDTPAPSDPLEIEVARRAAVLVWRAVPYFELRYGERGRRFGLSDGAWLVTLAHLPEPTRRNQVDWLTRVLAPRGMPSWLLEVQLEVTARVGGKLGWDGAGAMREAAAPLARARRERLSEAAFAEADARFAERAGRSRLAAGTGRLVAAALIDVARGLCPSAAPVIDWLADPARFDPAWCAAVVETRAFVAAELDPR
jgi:hypothetical protein